MEFKELIEMIKKEAKEAKERKAKEHDYLVNKIVESDMFSFAKNFSFANLLENTVFKESEDSDIENNEDTEEIIEEIEMKKEEKAVSSLQQNNDLEDIKAVMTPDKLRQAIIYSEIIGKPRCKTRRRRRV